jgi:hypothetical protein
VSHTPGCGWRDARSLDFDDIFIRVSRGSALNKCAEESVCGERRHHRHTLGVYSCHHRAHSSSCKQSLDHPCSNKQAVGMQSNPQLCVRCSFANWIDLFNRLDFWHAALDDQSISINKQDRSWVWVCVSFVDWCVCVFVLWLWGGVRCNEGKQG